MAQFRDPKMTAMQAAEKFAATNWPEPRKIGRWHNNNGGPLKFKLADGVKWYQVLRLGMIGWEITDAE